MAATLAGCRALGQEAECKLEYVPEGLSGTIGRPLDVEWGTVPVDYVRLNSHPHVVGNGTTGYVEVHDDGFLVVSIQDSMRRDAGRTPRRWTGAYHYEMTRTEEGRRVIYEWSTTVARSGTEKAEEARAGRFVPRRREQDNPQVSIWGCKG